MLFSELTRARYEISLDEAYDSVTLYGNLCGDAWLMTLSQNEQVNNKWKELGCPSAKFKLEIWRAEDSEGNVPPTKESTVKAVLCYNKDESSEGSGLMHMHPQIFDLMVKQLRYKLTSVEFLFSGEGASVKKVTESSLECKINFRVLKMMGDF